jgi:hypothetical protein
MPPAALAPSENGLFSHQSKLKSKPTNAPKGALPKTKAKTSITSNTLLNVFFKTIPRNTVKHMNILP